ncbi:MAG TPA: GvpL/GvpF family gas vesicle protein [Symbiobacteriaceae bacterium]|nr:GvpL/GvpF family gas vesicle protein [Symbiobacteriaceae bacterium]
MNYVYGITGAPVTAPLPPGVGGAPVTQYLAVPDLHVLVSPTDELGPDPTAENTLAHHQVLTAAMAAGTVIPFAFGYVLPEALVHKLAESAREECLKLLPALAGKLEVGLKLIWTKAAFLPDIETPEVEAARKRAEATRGLEAQVGELLQAAADARRAEYVRLIHEPLAAGAVASRLNETIGPRMILNAAYLLDRAGESEFDALVGRVCAPCAGKLDIRYTGPWPPYNFVTLRVRLEEGGA